MRVTVFGASGKVGRLVVQQLLEEGHEVVAFVHHSSPFPETERLQIKRGDIHSLDDVKLAVKDSGVIISALGSWGTKRKDIVASGMKNIIPAMSTYHIKRVVSLTGSDAVAISDLPGVVSRFLHAVISLSPARKILADGEEHIRLLESSDLDWTVLRSPIMNNRKRGKSIVTQTKPKPWETVNRQVVASAMVDLINAKEYYKKAPYIRRIF